LKARKSNVRNKAREMKIFCWKVLARKALQEDLEACQIIIDLAEPPTEVEP
jgi:hypothetical protein